MASADFCPVFPSSLEDGSHRATGQISPGNAHLLSRLYPPHIRPRVPDRVGTLKILAFLSRAAASMRFLFVGPAFCLRLPSDPASRRAPLPSG
jgi:hypothetical protein